MPAEEHLSLPAVTDVYRLQVQKMEELSRETAVNCDLYMARIYLGTNRMEQAQTLLEYLLMQPTYPYFLDQARRLKEEGK